MPAAVGYYVKGQKLAFPYGERLLAGPFETFAEAAAEQQRLRPLYADANLTVETLRKSKLPVVSPRKGKPEGFDLSRADERRAAARSIAEHCRQHGFEAVIEDWDGEPDVDVTLPTLRASIWLGDTPAAPMPLVSWVAEQGRALATDVPGAWRDGPQNVGSRKRTSEPATWAELLDALITGLCAGLDGSAFRA